MTNKRRRIAWALGGTVVFSGLAYLLLLNAAFVNRQQEFGANGQYDRTLREVHAADAIALDALPLGLAQGAKVTRAVAKGDYLTYANCQPDDALKIVEVRREQDAFIREAGRELAAAPVG